MSTAAMSKLSWPSGWSVQTFHMAVLAERQHRIPDFSADVGLSPKSVRAVVAEVEELSAKMGRYLFDHHVKPEAWQPAPHIPRSVQESVERVYVREYFSPTRILQLSDAGQDEELLLTRACCDCGDMVVITIGLAAAAVRKHRLHKGGRKYWPSRRCLLCRDKYNQQQQDLRASVGAQIKAKRAAELTS
jgi:hypothetical protein